LALLGLRQRHPRRACDVDARRAAEGVSMKHGIATTGRGGQFAPGTLLDTLIGTVGTKDFVDVVVPEEADAEAQYAFVLQVAKALWDKGYALDMRRRENGHLAMRAEVPSIDDVGEFGPMFGFRNAVHD